MMAAVLARMRSPDWPSLAAARSTSSWRAHVCHRWPRMHTCMHAHMHALHAHMHALHAHMHAMHAHMHALHAHIRIRGYAYMHSTRTAGGCLSLGKQAHNMCTCTRARTAGGSLSLVGHHLLDRASHPAAYHPTRHTSQYPPPPRLGGKSRHVSSRHVKSRQVSSSPPSRMGGGVLRHGQARRRPSRRAFIPKKREFTPTHPRATLR